MHRCSVTLDGAKQRREWSVVIGREVGSKRHGTLARDEGGVKGRRLMFTCVEQVQEVVIALCSFLCYHVPSDSENPFLDHASYLSKTFFYVLLLNNHWRFLFFIKRKYMYRILECNCYII